MRLCCLCGMTTDETQPHLCPSEVVPLLSKVFAQLASA
jgi:NMD protein affecting ribosome stability and mRNA decay